MKRLRMFAVCLLILSLALSGSVAATSNEEIVIGVSAASFAHEWVDWIFKGMEDVAEEYNVTIKKSDAQWDYSKQVSHVETYIQSGVDGLVVILGEASSVEMAAAKAEEADTPLIFIDGGLLVPGVVTNISADNVELGRMTGRHIAEKLGGDGKMVILHNPMEAVSRNRMIGLNEVLADFPGIEILEEHVVQAENETERAKQITEGLILKYPGELDAIWAAWDGMAIGAASALDAVGNTNVIVTSIDGTRIALQMLQQGSALDYVIAQRPREMGRICIEMMVRAIEGDRVNPIQIMLPSVAYTKDTAPADFIGASGE